MSILHFGNWSFTYLCDHTSDDINVLSWFQKILNVFPVRWYVLHTFVDSFQGFYKNGIEPDTRDCRWFSSVFFIIRLALLLVGALTLDVSYFVIGPMILIVSIILIIIIQPLKENKSHYSIINAVFIIILALAYSSIIGYNTAVLKRSTMMSCFLIFGTLVGVLPLVYVIHTNFTLSL